MDNKNFGLYSLYYDLFYKDKDYLGEADYVFKKLKRYLPFVQDVLELGIGTGNHAELLMKKGLNIVGIELSELMASQARKKGIHCYVKDCSEFSLGRKFDAVISLFHVISYINENEKLIKTFRNVNQHLNVGGIFLFDVWYSPAVYHLKPEIRIRRIQNDKLRITRLAEPKMLYNSNVVEVNYEIIIENKQDGSTTYFNEIHSMRHFSLPEISILASFCGFEIIETEGWMTNEIPSEKTWGVLFILRKKVE